MMEQLIDLVKIGECLGEMNTQKNDTIWNQNETNLQRHLIF